MVGHVSMRSAQLWVQAVGPSRWWQSTCPQPQAKNRLGLSTSPVQTDATSGHTAHITLANLEPGTTYSVKFKLNGKAIDDVLEVSTQVLWDYRMDPPAFSFVTGSCAFINEPKYDRPGTPYGGGYEIFERMADEQPDMMLWLGDNIYLREVDFQSYEGFVHRYTHARQTPEMRRLLPSLPQLRHLGRPRFWPQRQRRQLGACRLVA